jgi:hypothetical protein
MTEEEKQELRGRLISFISRKFVLALIVLIVSTVVVLEGQLDARIWLGIVAADVIGYDYGNAKSKQVR